MSAKITKAVHSCGVKKHIALKYSSTSQKDYLSSSAKATKTFD